MATFVDRSDGRAVAMAPYPLAKPMAERREYAGNIALVQGLINGKAI